MTLCCPSENDCRRHLMSKERKPLKKKDRRGYATEITEETLATKRQFWQALERDNTQKGRGAWNENSFLTFSESCVFVIRINCKYISDMKKKNRKMHQII